MTKQNDKPENYKYHSTSQFRNVVSHIRQGVQFKGLDANGEAIIDKNAMAPALDYIGTVKTHGTNASIIIHGNGVVSLHSKSQLLAYWNVDGDFIFHKDNAGFALAMEARYVGVQELVYQANVLGGEIDSTSRYPIKISGEWIGPSIQKGVGVSLLKQKTLVIFGVKFGHTNQENKTGWLPVTNVAQLKSHKHHIYNVMEFPHKEIIINFMEPEYSQNTLVSATEEVERECPVAKQLEVDSDELVGEGLVWTPVDPSYAYDTGTWFKTKGKKHSVSKVKSVAAVSPEKLASIAEFVEYAVTGTRLEQGVSEVGLSQKLFGSFIGWVNRDIHKEELDVLEKSDLTMKDVGSKVTSKARVFYLDKLNNV